MGGHCSHSLLLQHNDSGPGVGANYAGQIFSTRSAQTGPHSDTPRRVMPRGASRLSTKLLRTARVLFPAAYFSSFFNPPPGWRGGKGGRDFSDRSTCGPRLFLFFGVNGSVYAVQTALPQSGMNLRRRLIHNPCGTEQLPIYTCRGWERIKVWFVPLGFFVMGQH